MLSGCVFKGEKIKMWWFSQNNCFLYMFPNLLVLGWKITNLITIKFFWNKDAFKSKRIFITENDIWFGFYGHTHNI